MEGDGQSPPPLAPMAPGMARCVEHGMQYDATTQTGCVVCRRGGPSPSATLGDRIADLPPKAKIGAAAGAGFLIVLLSFFALRSVLSSPPADSAGAGAVANDGTPASALKSYIQSVHAAEKALPLDEAREVLAGMGEEMKAGTLDVAMRRPKVEDYRSRIEAQRDAFAAIEAPEVAAVYRSIMVDWYGSIIALISVTLTELRLSDDIKGLIARKAQVSTREEATALQDDFKAKQAEVSSAVENGRRLASDAKAQSQRKKEEEARLIGELKLTIDP